MAQSVQRELGAKPPGAASKLNEESFLGEVYQSEDSKSLQDAVDLLSKKFEIIGVNIIDLKKVRTKAQKQIECLEHEKDLYVKTEFFRNEH